jgi:hypothetical protein
MLYNTYILEFDQSAIFFDDASHHQKKLGGILLLFHVFCGESKR